MKNPVDILKNLIGDDLLALYESHEGVNVAALDRRKLLDTARLIRDNPDLRLRYLSYITAVDCLQTERVFYLIYEFVNLDNDNRLRLKVAVPEKEPWIPSITSIYPSANWHEREMMEMFGIKVMEHPDPRKLLLPDWVNENPLRKSFPHEGEELWKFHERIIEMFNEKSEYRGRTDDPWVERFIE
jgi:NADH-quinone oxidoreductase subunit C